MTVDNEIEVIELIEQPALVICRRVAASDIAACLGEVFGKVFNHIADLGATQAGMPFLRYLEIDESGFKIAAGMPVTEPQSGKGEIESHALPGGKAITARHLGDYAAVGEVWDRVWAHARSMGHEGPYSGWDVYVNDPSEVAPEEVETRLYLPV